MKGERNEGNMYRQSGCRMLFNNWQRMLIISFGSVYYKNKVCSKS